MAVGICASASAGAYRLDFARCASRIRRQSCGTSEGGGRRFHRPVGRAPLRVEPGEPAGPGHGQGAKGGVLLGAGFRAAARNGAVRPAGCQQDGAAAYKQRKLATAQDRDRKRAVIRIHCSHPQ
jgi:hypothetical protein